MKRSVIVFLFLAIFSVAAYAQMGQMEHGQMQGDHQMKMECPKMKMMQEGMKQGDHQMKMECPKMKHCQDSMQMMMSIVDMQEKILAGVNPEEKEKMIQDIKQMKEKMKNMMSSCKGMMGGMMGKHAPAAAAVPAPESSEKKEPAMTEPHHMTEPNKE